MLPTQSPCWLQMCAIITKRPPRRRARALLANVAMVAITLLPRRACSRPFRRSLASLTSVYTNAIESGRLRPDASQQHAVNVLTQLEKGDPELAGVYLCGEVGSGKSMVMDLMYEESSLQPRVRRHFHEFMLDVHSRLHKVQQARPRTVVLTESGLPVYKFGDAPTETPALAAAPAAVAAPTPKGSAADEAEGGQQTAPPPPPPPPPPDPLATVLDELTERGALRLLCLDELQVTDVVDAVLLRRLFDGLFERGVRVAFTSNRECACTLRRPAPPPRTPRATHAASLLSHRRRVPVPLLHRRCAGRSACTSAASTARTSSRSSRWCGRWLLTHHDARTHRPAGGTLHHTRAQVVSHTDVVVVAALRGGACW